MVIVGGGFGGLDAARAFDGAPVQVTLLDRHNYHLFQPMLYQVATAALSPGDVASPIRWILRHQKNVRVLLGAGRSHRSERAGSSSSKKRRRRIHRTDDRLRLFDPRDRIHARLLRTPRMVHPCAGIKDARRCAGNPATGAARLRSRRARNRRSCPASAADVCDRRRGTDRGGTGGRPRPKSRDRRFVRIFGASAPSRHASSCSKAGLPS